jgi:Putative DNA-binding domain
LPTRTRLAALLQSSESKALDFKRLGAGKVAKMLETICAFANTEGGLLVVGIGDPKEVKPADKPEQRLWGLQENPEAFDEFQRKCRTHFNPPIDTISFYRLPCTLRGGSAGHVALVADTKVSALRNRERCPQRRQQLLFYVVKDSGHLSPMRELLCMGLARLKRTIPDEISRSPDQGRAVPAASMPPSRYSLAAHPMRCRTVPPRRPD